uniref:Uncharacterized protein n=1 Tax=Trichogramma kaykai TaxID=54128 RepID=A0ABD2XGZ8_9HYME
MKSINFSYFWEDKCSIISDSIEERFGLARKTIDSDYFGIFAVTFDSANIGMQGIANYHVKNFILKNPHVQYGADVNTQDEDGNSSMMNLFDEESNDMRICIKALELLLDLIFEYNAEKNSIILEAVKLLIERGVGINVRNGNGQSALHVAVEYCKDIKKDRTYIYIDFSTLFMKIFVDVFSKSMLLHRILRCDNRENLSEQLVKGLEFLLLPHRGSFVIGVKTTFRFRSPKIISVTYSELSLNSEQMKLFANKLAAVLKNGADVNMKDNNGKTALHQAVYRTRTKHVAFLLKNGADPNITDVNGDIPLNYNFRSYDSKRLLQKLEKFLTILKLNIQHNADISHYGGDGKTVLHLLIKKIRKFTLTPKKADWETVSKFVHQYMEILLKHGLDVNIKDGDGSTALNEAVSYCDYDTAKILVEHGADVNTVQFKGGFLENKVPQSLNLLTTLNVLAIIELWQSKGFQINNYQYLKVFKFLMFFEDSEMNNDHHSLLRKLWYKSDTTLIKDLHWKDVFEFGNSKTWLRSSSRNNNFHDFGCGHFLFMLKMASITIIRCFKEI